MCGVEKVWKEWRDIHNIQLLRFHVYISFDLVKRCMLNFVLVRYSASLIERKMRGKSVCVCVGGGGEVKMG